MDEGLAQRFEQNRTRLRAVAYRMLGSLSGADDAVQESWLRLNRTDTSDPDVLLRVDTGAVPAGASGLVRGAHAVAQRAQSFAWRAQFARRALVNGAAGLAVVPHDRPYAIIGFTIRDGRIVQIDILADPARLRQFDLATLRA